MDKKKPVTATFRIDSAIMAELRKAAKADRRSLNSLVNIRLAEAAQAAKGAK